MDTRQFTPPIDLRGQGIKALRSLRRQSDQGLPPALYYVIILDAGEFVLPDTALRRADSFAVDRLTEAALMALGHHQRLLGALSPRGFDAAWSKGFREGVGLLSDLADAAIAEQHRDEVTALISTSTFTLLAGEVRSVLLLATPAGSRNFFTSQVSDLGSARGVLSAAREILSKAAMDPLRARLQEFGVTPQKLKDIGDLHQRARKEHHDAIIESSSSEQLPTALRLLRAMILQELAALSATARADLGEELAAPLQMTNLLDLASRREAPPEPADRKSVV